MEIYRGTVKEEGACNFCDKGKVKENGRGLVYPYENVVLLKGKQAKVSFCDECFEKLKNCETP